MLLTSAQAVANSSGTPSMMATVIVASIAALPGILGFIYSWRKRRDVALHTATEFGTQLAQTAFHNMESQVTRLSGRVVSLHEEHRVEMEKWDEDRDRWEQDKLLLLGKIGDLHDQLHQTNMYLQLLLATLDIHGIQRPTPPVGLNL